MGNESQIEAVKVSAFNWGFQLGSAMVVVVAAAAAVVGSWLTFVGGKFLSVLMFQDSNRCVLRRIPYVSYG
jgi:membrane protein DedA with SNARE-associated domain